MKTTRGGYGDDTLVWHEYWVSQQYVYSHTDCTGQSEWEYIYYTVWEFENDSSKDACAENCL